MPSGWPKTAAVPFPGRVSRPARRYSVRPFRYAMSRKRGNGAACGYQIDDVGGSIGDVKHSRFTHRDRRRRLTLLRGWDRSGSGNGLRSAGPNRCDVIVIDDVRQTGGIRRERFDLFESGRNPRHAPRSWRLIHGRSTRENERAQRAAVRNARDELSRIGRGERNRQGVPAQCPEPGSEGDDRHVVVAIIRDRPANVGPQAYVINGTGMCRADRVRLRNRRYAGASAAAPCEKHKTQPDAPARPHIAPPGTKTPCRKYAQAGARAWQARGGLHPLQLHCTGQAGILVDCARARRTRRGTSLRQRWDGLRDNVRTAIPAQAAAGMGIQPSTGSGSFAGTG